MWAAWTIVRARRHGLLRLRRVRAPVRLDCLHDKCGLCCQVLGHARVEAEEAQPLIELQVVRRSRDGLRLATHGATCQLLQGNLCSAYHLRPRSCREYPWYSVDGVLFYDAGCPGIKSDRHEHPEPATITPAEILFGMFPRAVRWLVLRILRLW